MVGPFRSRAKCNRCRRSPVELFRVRDAFRHGLQVHGGLIGVDGRESKSIARTHGIVPKIVSIAGARIQIRQGDRGGLSYPHESVPGDGCAENMAAGSDVQREIGSHLVGTDPLAIHADLCDGSMYQRYGLRFSNEVNASHAGRRRSRDKWMVLQFDGEARFLRAAGGQHRGRFEWAEKRLGRRALTAQGACTSENHESRKRKQQRAHGVLLSGGASLRTRSAAPVSFHWTDVCALGMQAGGENI